MGTIGLVFDLGSSYQSRGNFNHDPGVECLEEASVALLSELIESMGHRCVGIPSTQQLAALASAKIPNLLDGFVNYGTGYDQGHRYVHTAVLLEVIGAPYAGNDPMRMGIYSLPKYSVIIDAIKLLNHEFPVILQIGDVFQNSVGTQRRTIWE